MLKKKFKSRNSRDFCNVWRRLYYEKYNEKFHIKWVLDGPAFRRLMSTYSNVTLMELIKFVFADNTNTTKFLRSTGYNVSIFERDVNKYYRYVKSGGIDVAKLNLDIPYWDNTDFSFIVNCVNSGDFEFLAKLNYSEETEETWLFLKATVKKQDPTMSLKFQIYYERWKRLSTVKRRRIRKLS